MAGEFDVNPEPLNPEPVNGYEKGLLLWILLAEMNGGCRILRYDHPR